MQSTRIQRQNEIPYENYWDMMLDELVNLDDKRLVALDFFIRQKERVTRAYNKKDKVKTFLTRYCVWKVIFHIDRKYKYLRKWSLH